MNLIDITPFGKRRNMGGSHEHIFYSSEHDGKEAALGTRLSDKLAEGKVNVVCHWKFWPDREPNATMEYQWVRGFLASSVAKLGAFEVSERLSINGVAVYTKSPKPTISLANIFWGELEAASVKQEKDAKKKAKDALPENWSDACKFLIPDIGTKIQLDHAWSFELHSEYRNKSFIEILGFTFSWQDEKVFPVRIQEGANLSVDRIYIRKGAAEYSSITFYLAKGSTIWYDGKEIVTKKAVRFWAKLSDVNKMIVLINQNSLASN